MLLLGVLLAGCGSVVQDQKTGEFVEDAVITARVKAGLAQEPGVSAPAISVETLRGVVLLSGFIENEDQRAKAIAAARRAGGVLDVKADGLILRPQRPGN